MKIFIENLTHSVTNNDLIKLFELSGDVESITIVNDKFSRKPGGFVEMPNRLEALEMIQNFNGVTLFGETLILTPMREVVDLRASVDRRSEQGRRNYEDKRIASDRRVKSTGYAFDKRFDSERRAELDRRQIKTRRLSSDRRLVADRRQ